LDVAVTTSDTHKLSVLLGYGDGTFKPQIAFSTGTVPLSIGVGDFNGDSRMDLAVANYGNNTISIMLNSC
jgi:hypothetical protein